MAETLDNRRERRRWEHNFPGLDAEWAYWWIEGDGELLAVVGAADLGAALEVVEKHAAECLGIVAHAAKLDSFGEVVRK